MMQVLKSNASSSNRAIIFAGAIIFCFGLYSAYLSIRSFVSGVNIVINLAIYGLCFVPVFLGFGLLALGLKWDKKIILSSLALSCLGVFFFLLFVSLLVAGVIK